MASQIFKVRWGIRGETFSLPIATTFEISTVNLSLRPPRRLALAPDPSPAPAHPPPPLPKPPPLETRHASLQKLR